MGVSVWHQWYYARLRVECANPALNSRWLVSPDPSHTLPSCTWQSHSGRDDLYECSDGSFCAAESCCNASGFRARCPRNAPVMCNSKTCAGGQDYCCATDCSDLGGNRPCEPAPRTPADAPYDISITSVGDVFCSVGIGLRSGGTCCPVSCGACGGLGCWIFPGGEENCCPEAIHRAGRACGTPEDTACVIPAEPITLAWHKGANAHDCVFVAWMVEYRPLELFSREVTSEWVTQYGNWKAAPECSTTSSQCVVTSMSATQVYEVRIKETCSDPLADGSYGQSLPFRWRAPGHWEVYVGPSPASPTKLTDMMGVPSYCEAIRTSHDFTFCYGQSTRDELVLITRTDLPTGWTEQLWLLCRLSSFPAPASWTRSPAKQPALLQASAVDAFSISIAFDLGPDVGDCTCAVPELQLRAGSTGSWQVLDGACADVLSRQCFVADLTPDTLYFTRARVRCRDSSLHSNFTEAAPVGTLPGCIWTTHSGHDSEFQCGDGSFCSMLDEACCSARGRILRCPRDAPVMCADPTGCAGETDYCCAAECSSQGGPRACTTRDVLPAKIADLHVDLKSPSTVALNWSMGEYVSGEQSTCDFAEWIVEMRPAILNATAHPYAEVQQPYYRTYGDVVAWLQVVQTSCNIGCCLGCGYFRIHC